MKLQEADLYFTRLLRLNPFYEAAYANRGLCKMFLGDKPGACEDFRHSIAIGQDYDVIDEEKLSVWVKKNCGG